MAKNKSDLIDQKKAELKELKKTGSFQEVKQLQEEIADLKNPNSVARIYKRFRTEQQEIRYGKSSENEKKTSLVESMRKYADEIENSISED